MSIAITSSNFIFLSFFGCTTFKGSILCSLFLIYIKSNHIVSIVKQLAADDILIFTAICSNFTWNIKLTFKSKSEWTSIMSFNQDLNSAQKVIFSWKMTKSFHSQISFNIYYLQKFYLNDKLNLYYHI